jgi:uncharacterized protein (TIGR02646 family)
MKHITKQAELQAFIDWKATGAKTFNDLHQTALKQELKNALIEEQGAICCYCESRVANHNSHVEHLKPQSAFQNDQLDYLNLLCSCQKQLSKGEDRHCGNSKENWYDSNLLVSPLDTNCEKRFAYTQRGKIKAASKTDDATKKTIGHLKLNIPKLNASRQKAIDPFLDEDLSVSELKRLVSDYLQPDAKGHFSEFHTTIRQLFGEYLMSNPT